MEEISADDLIKDLEENVYCRLRPSGVAGVGVFAIRDIPKGIDPFNNFFKHDFIQIDPKRIFENGKIDPAVKELIDDMYVVADGELNLFNGGMNGINLSFFVNYSADKPNMEAINDGANFIAARDIKKGEELFVNYETYAENVHDRP
jgi:hypothetical protein